MIPVPSPRACVTGLRTAVGEPIVVEAVVGAGHRRLVATPTEAMPTDTEASVGRLAALSHRDCQHRGQRAITASRSPAGSCGADDARAGSKRACRTAPAAGGFVTRAAAARPRRASVLPKQQALLGRFRTSRQRLAGCVEGSAGDLTRNPSGDLSKGGTGPADSRRSRAPLAVTVQLTSRDPGCAALPKWPRVLRRRRRPPNTAKATPSLGG